MRHLAAPNARPIFATHGERGAPLVKKTKTKSIHKINFSRGTKQKAVKPSKPSRQDTQSKHSKQDKHSKQSQQSQQAKQAKQPKQSQALQCHEKQNSHRSQPHVPTTGPDHRSQPQVPTAGPDIYIYTHVCICNTRGGLALCAAWPGVHIQT